MGVEIDFAELRRSSRPMTSFREPRHSVMMQATLSCGGGAASVRVRNISARGMMAECCFRGPAGSRVEISMRGIGDITGRVAWTAKDCIGVEFEDAIDPAAVLRKPVPYEVSPLVRPVERAWRPPLHCS